MSSRICVASIATPSLKELADMTMPNKIEYCERHGYSAALVTQVGKYLGYDKIHLIDGLLLSNKYDYVYWCDNDTLFTNFNKKIEDLIDDEHDFFICTDSAKHINAGVFIVKNSEGGRGYINHIKELMYKIPTQFRFGEEQTALLHSYKDSKFIDRIKIHPQRAMNGYPYIEVRNSDPATCFDELGTDGNWKDGDFMIHLPGFFPDFYDRLLVHMEHYLTRVIK